MEILLVTLGLLFLFFLPYLYSKWRIRRKGWKAGGGFWITIFLIYFGLFAYIKWPFSTPKKSKKERIQHRVNQEVLLQKDTINFNRA